MYAGFPSVTKMDVYGRGKQRGMRVGEVTYDELPKEMIFTVVKESDKDFVIKIIMQAARTGNKGAYGDGKIFVSEVEEVYTVSSGLREADEAVLAGKSSAAAGS
jgi:nitrogen regulatory protein PII 1